jgi:hypothetical protein
MMQRQKIERRIRILGFLQVCLLFKHQEVKDSTDF